MLSSVFLNANTHLPQIFYFNSPDLQHIQGSTAVKQIFQFRLHALYVSLTFVKSKIK